jgi:hypothetical protein
MTDREYDGELESEQLDEHNRLTSDPADLSTIGPATGAYAGGERGTYPDAAGTSSPTANPVPPGEGVSQGFLHFGQEFNDHWEKNYSGTGRTWDDYRPAYQFGYDVAYDRRFRGREWTDLEPEVSRVWEAGKRELAWPLVKEAAAYAWERVSHNTLDLIEPGQQ